MLSRNCEFCRGPVIWGEKHTCFSAHVPHVPVAPYRPEHLASAPAELECEEMNRYMDYACDTLSGGFDVHLGTVYGTPDLPGYLFDEKLAERISLFLSQGFEVEEDCHPNSVSFHIPKLKER